MRKNIRFGLALGFAATSLLVTGVFAATEEFEEAKVLISQGTSCQQLNSNQLDKMGDYYMEQMMPGTAHKNMEQLLGGEGSEGLKQMHILMARRWYCGDAVGMGMMGMMSGAYGLPGMVGGNLTSANNSNLNPRGMMSGWFGSNWDRGYGMMGFGSGFGWGGALFSILSVILLLAGIAAIVKYLLKK